MSLKSSNKFALTVYLASGIAVLLLSVFVFLNRQLISDTVVTLFYQPSVSIQAVESRVDFTGDGTRIFYATQPEVLDAQAFNERCPRQEVKNPILGCYVTDDRIYIYSITNQELQGIEEVTAAHEMLHAAWMRLSVSEREALQPSLQRLYESVADGALKERMNYYERTQPGEFYNELHSIFGTEVEGVGSELEAHYARYFEDRTAVIDYFSQYSGVFQALRDKADSLYGQMEALSEKITSERNNYEEKLTALSADTNSFNARASRGAFSSEQAFYNERATLVQRSQILEEDRATLNADINTFNKLRAQYVDVAAELEQLDKSLDSFQVLDSPPTLRQ
jgi:hypothetical protein